MTTTTNDNNEETVRVKLMSDPPTGWLSKSYAFDNDVDKRISDLASQVTQLDSQYRKIMKGLRSHSMTPTEKKDTQKEKIEKSLELQEKIIEGLG